MREFEMSVEEEALDHEVPANHSCGVFGVSLSKPEKSINGSDASRLTYYSLFSLQHRGQESAGIAVYNEDADFSFKNMGLVSQAFYEADFDRLHGEIAIGHVRYSTTGSWNFMNSQPISSGSKWGMIYIAHNGNLINADELREEMRFKGETFETTTDSEVILKLIARSEETEIVEAIKATMNRIRGAYAALVLSDEGIFGFRDPLGIRPMCIGKLKGHFEGYVLASETCAFDVIGASLLDDDSHEVQPGSIVKLGRKGSEPVITGRNDVFPDGFKSAPEEARAICMFEFIYFARPDSILYGKRIYQVRREMGRRLAALYEGRIEENLPFAGRYNNPADLVIPVPDTGTPAAIGYAEASGIYFGEGFIKNRYIGRTFIQPTQGIRKLGIRLKLNPLTEAIDGKNLIVVDDSIVRSNTTRQIVKMLRDAGAREIHLRISSPPIYYPCYFGIDTAKKEELIAARMEKKIIEKTASRHLDYRAKRPEVSEVVEAIRREIDVDSLGYLPVSTMLSSTGITEQVFCVACFTGKYPLPVHEEDINRMSEKDRLETSKDRQGV